MPKTYQRADGRTRHWGMPGGMGYGMQCPACGETMAKPSKEQFLEMLERRKQRLAAVLEHINMEIDKLKETMEEEKKEKT